MLILFVTRENLVLCDCQKTSFLLAGTSWLCIQWSRAPSALSQTAGQRNIRGIQNLDHFCVTSLCPQVNFSVHNHFLPGPCIIIENLISFRLTGIICQSNADLSRTKNIAAKYFLTEDEFLTTTFGQYLYSTDRHYKIIAFNWSCEIFAFHCNALFFATNVWGKLLCPTLLLAIFLKPGESDSICRKLHKII